MRAQENFISIEGYLYNHKLVERTVQNKESKMYGQTFIGGTVNVAVDEEGMNVIEVRYNFITPTTKDGSPNRTYNTLAKIIKENPTWLAVGKENCEKVSITRARLVENNFIGRDGQMVSAKSNEASFINILDRQVSPENRFSVDIVLNGLREIDEDPERGLDAYAVLKGYVFDFRNEAQQVELTVRNADAINYFAGLDLSNSNVVYTKVWGEINSTTVERKVEVPSAFGAPQIRTTTSTAKEWLVTGAQAEPYDFDDEGTITADELRASLQAREVRLAGVQERHDRQSTPASAFAAGPTTPVSELIAKKGNFNF